MQRDPNVRAGDGDRDLAADALRRHYADGRLEPAEFAERLDAVLAARTYGELDAAVADLPADDEATAKAGDAERYRNLPVDPSSTHRPVHQPDRDVGISLYTLADLAAWAGLSAISWVAWVLLVVFTPAGAQYFWPLWVTVLGGVAVVVRAVGRRGDHGGA
jgi:hypothetical protein